MTSSSSLLAQAQQDILNKCYLEAFNTLKEIAPTDPLHPIALAHIGLCFVMSQSVENGLHLIDQAIGMAHQDPKIWNVKGTAAKFLDDIKAAKECFQQALKLDPYNVNAHENLAEILSKSGDIRKGISHYRLALRKAPKQPRLIYNLAITLFFDGQIPKSLNVFEDLYQIDPEYENLWLHYSHALFLDAQYKRAFHLYRTRIKRTRNPDIELISQNTPEWQGEDLNGKTILAVWEQGLGDSLQNIRYLKSFKDQGATVHLCVQSALIPLMDEQPYIEKVHIWRTGELPVCNYYVPLMEIPQHLCRLNKDFYNASQIPYIELQPRIRPGWMDKLNTNKLKIGLVWQGNPQHARDGSRSIPLSEFRPLRKLKDVQFFAIQTKNGLDQLEGQDWLTNLEPYIMGENNGILAMAHVIDTLDLVICCDTMPAHLAGALGKPVKLLTSTIPDWRWSINQQFSAWYPKTEIIRRKKQDSWKQTIKILVEHLKEEFAL